MAGLCEGGNEPAGSLKAICNTESYPAFARIGLRENPGKKPQAGNLPRPGFEPGPPGFAARRADRYSTGVVGRTREYLEKMMKPEAEDETDLFFRTMAATVKKFDPEVRTEAKMKIFSLVTEMEVRSYRSIRVGNASTFDSENSRPSSNASYNSNCSTGEPSAVPTVFKGLMHHEFIAEGRTVTKELYVETLRRLWDAVRRKRPEKWVENNWFLMHDNAPAHRAIIVKNFLARHNITALDHPPYSPDLSPPDYFLFPRLKSHLKGRRFNAEEVIANATRALRRVSQNGFRPASRNSTRVGKSVLLRKATILKGML
ncbi:hypothetical protein ANN_00595 [Periplaneta americana]|uniref:BESS domain-containing protein n=1 Tax=Periplaneta americana TaxID=6978 RepID=A0ABQ8TSC1_PERAM|nr:hypothetical protein ANN_00595 [Periplaneta americana]